MPLHQQLVLGILAAKRFKCKSYLWVHDLWPESVRVAGGINNKLVLGIIDCMTRLIYHFTDIILVQSPYFKNTLGNKKVDLKKVIYYPYYAEHFYKPVIPDPKLKKFPEGFNIIFAGNIGVAQSFETIIGAFDRLRDLKINLVVLGDRRDKKRILKLIKEKKLDHKFYFLDHILLKICPITLLVEMDC